MPWPGASSATRSGHIVPRPSKPDPADDPSRLASASVNHRIWASRLQAQRASGSSPALITSHDLRALASSGDYGRIFDRSEEIQAEFRRKKRIAGPDAPPSWRSEATMKAARSSGKRAIITVGDSYRPASLREECLIAVLKDLATTGSLVDEVGVLPWALKQALVNLAPRIAPLDDISTEALLGDLSTEDAQAESESETSDPSQEWEGTANRIDLDGTLEIASLDLSYSRLSVGMLSQILVVPQSSSQCRPRPRFPSLRTLDLSHSTIRLAPSLIAICHTLSLHTLSLVAVDCALAAPLAALASALPSLRRLDLSENAWLEWAHLSEPDWAKQWTALEWVKLSGCEKLSPQPSFMDPEGRAGGPAAVVQAISLIREAGRQKWLEVVM